MDVWLVLHIRTNKHCNYDELPGIGTELASLVAKGTLGINYSVDTCDGGGYSDVSMILMHIYNALSLRIRIWLHTVTDHHQNVPTVVTLICKVCPHKT